MASEALKTSSRASIESRGQTDGVTVLELVNAGLFELKTAVCVEAIHEDSHAPCPGTLVMMIMMMVIMVMMMLVVVMMMMVMMMVVVMMAMTVVMMVVLVMMVLMVMTMVIVVIVMVMMMMVTVLVVMAISGSARPTPVAVVSDRQPPLIYGEDDVAASRSELDLSSRHLHTSYRHTIQHTVQQQPPTPVCCLTDLFIKEK